MATANRCNYIFVKGYQNGQQCITKPIKNAEFCSAHKPKVIPLPTTETLSTTYIFKQGIHDGAQYTTNIYQYIFKQGFRKGARCTTKPKNTEFCTAHKPKHVPKQDEEFETNVLQCGVFKSKNK